MIKIFVLLCIVFTSCINQPSNGADIQVETNKADTITYQYKNFKEISKYFAGNDDVIDTAYYSVSYPFFESDSINKVLNPSILLEGEEEAKYAAESFIAGYNEFVEETSTSTISAAWYKNVKAEILINTPLIVSMKTSVNEYTGGAHGMRYAVLSNYDVQTNKKVELADLLLPKKLEALLKIGERHFRKQENLASTDSLQKDYFFDNGIFALNDNFGLTKNDLIVYYSEYEIQPYSEGPITLRIPYTDLADILSDRGKAYIKSIQ